MIKRIILAVSILAAPMAFAGDNSMVVVQVRDLAKANAQVAALAEKLELPLPPGLVQGQIGMLVMSPDLAGVELAKPITLFVEKFSIEQMQPPQVVVRFAVADDGSDYLSSVEQQIPASKEIEPGVHKFALGEADDPEAPAFFVVIKDGLAAVGNNLEAIRKLQDDVGEAESQALAALPGEVSISLNVAAVRELVAAQMKQQVEMFEAYKAQMEAEGMDTAAFDQGNPAAGLDAVNDVLQRVLAQLELLVINLDVARDITIRTHVQPVAGSVLEDMMADLTAPPALISGQRMPDAWLSGYGTLTGFDRVLEPYADWVVDLYRQMGPPLSDFASSYKDLVLGMKGLYRGGYNLFVLPSETGAPLQLVGIYEITDKEKARTAMREMMKMQETQGQSMTNELGYSMKVKQSSEDPYKEVEIETYALAYDFVDEASGEEMPETVKDLFASLKYSVGYMDNHMIFAFGSIDGLHQAIDYIQGGGASEPVRDGFADVSGDALGYWNLSIAGLIRSVVALIPQGPGTDSLSALQDTEASIRGLAIKELNGLSSLVRLTQEDLAGLMQIGMALAPRGGPGFSPADEGMMMEEMPMDEESSGEGEFPIEQDEGSAE